MCVNTDNPCQRQGNMLDWRRVWSMPPDVPLQRILYTYTEKTLPSFHRLEQGEGGGDIV